MILPYHKKFKISKIFFFSLLDLQLERHHSQFALMLSSLYFAKQLVFYYRAARWVCSTTSGYFFAFFFVDEKVEGIEVASITKKTWTKSLYSALSAIQNIWYFYLIRNEHNEISTLCCGSDMCDAWDIVRRMEKTQSRDPRRLIKFFRIVHDGKLRWNDIWISQFRTYICMAECDAQNRVWLHKRMTSYCPY